MSKQRRHEIARITLRYVRLEAINRRGRRDDYYPACRGNRHEDCDFYPAWNVRYEYKSLSVRGGGQSMYWCDVCLPERYRTVADSMLRGHENYRLLGGVALKAVLGPPPQDTRGSSRIPWRSLL